MTTPTTNAAEEVFCKQRAEHNDQVLNELKELVGEVTLQGEEIHINRAKPIIENRLKHFVNIISAANELVDNDDALNKLDDLIDIIIVNPHTRFWNGTRHLKTSAILRKSVSNLPDTYPHKKKLLFVCEHMMSKE